MTLMDEATRGPAGGQPTQALRSDVGRTEIMAMEMTESDYSLGLFRCRNNNAPWQITTGM